LHEEVRRFDWQIGVITANVTTLFIPDLLSRKQVK